MSIYAVIRVVVLLLVLVPLAAAVLVPVFGRAALIRQQSEHHGSGGDQRPENRRDVCLPLTPRFREYVLFHRTPLAPILTFDRGVCSRAPSDSSARGCSTCDRQLPGSA